MLVNWYFFEFTAGEAELLSSLSPEPPEEDDWDCEVGRGAAAGGIPAAELSLVEALPASEADPADAVFPPPVDEPPPPPVVPEGVLPEASDVVGLKGVIAKPAGGPEFKPLSKVKFVPAGPAGPVTVAVALPAVWGWLEVPPDVGGARATSSKPALGAKV